MLRVLILAAAAAAPLTVPLPAQAHKVIAAVFPSGDAIEGEVGLSNGDMARDVPVAAYDGEGRFLGETMTDDDGLFLFKPTEAVTHVFRVDLGAGHVAEVTMPAAQVARILGVDAPPSDADRPPGDATVTVASLSDAERAAIARIVRDETRPLRREIAALREHRDLQSILGGIGYIAGLAGVGYYIAARRKLGG